MDHPEYEAVIGLEVHAELKTESKIFCSCRTAFGAEPNTQCCPVCMGLPGSLPRLNRSAVALAIRAGLALECQIAPRSKFDRKQYFYPDLPKAYQISQNKYPLCKNGCLRIRTAAGTRRIRITRIHMEDRTPYRRSASDFRNRPPAKKNRGFPNACRYCTDQNTWEC